MNKPATMSINATTRRSVSCGVAWASFARFTCFLASLGSLVLKRDAAMIRLTRWDNFQRLRRRSASLPSFNPRSMLHSAFAEL